MCLSRALKSLCHRDFVGVLSKLLLPTLCLSPRRHSWLSERKSNKTLNLQLIYTVRIPDNFAVSTLLEQGTRGIDG